MGWRTWVAGSWIVGLVLVAGIAAPARASEDGVSVKDHAVGKRISDRELKEPGDTFAEGTQVVYWTRVVGGSEGDRIQHVWIHEGKEVVSVGLTIGGSHWRTYSRKTMHPGSTGEWVVEARDADGEVLSRGEFRCVAPDDDSRSG